MMQALQLLDTALISDQRVIDVVGSNAYAFVAPQELDKKFLVYNLSEEALETKDGIIPYRVRVSCSATSITEMLQIMDAAKEVMQEYPGIDALYEGSTEIEKPGDQHYQIDINFQLTINI